MGELSCCAALLSQLSYGSVLCHVGVVPPMLSVGVLCEFVCGSAVVIVVAAAVGVAAVGVAAGAVAAAGVVGVVAVTI